MLKPPATRPSVIQPSGALILNADDWGWDPYTTNRILECFQRQTVSSASAMVFMPDSERAAELALEHSLDTGLHLNLTTLPPVWSGPPRFLEHHEHVARYLLKNRLARTIFHPGLVTAFEYLVSAQLDEFARLYGKAPDHIDGHHHMHLCANVVLAKLLPDGVAVRRNFTFFPREKSYLNRLYRRLQDGYLSRRHPMPDYFVELSSSVQSGNFDRLCSLSQQFLVEVEAHPIRPAEYSSLIEGELYSRACAGDVTIAHCYSVARARVRHPPREESAPQTDRRLT